MRKHKNKLMRVYSSIIAGSIFLFFVFPAAAEPSTDVRKFISGTLIKGADPNVYLVTTDGLRRLIADEETFTAMGYSWSAVVSVTDAELDQYSLGDPLTTDNYRLVRPTSAEIEAIVKAYFADAPIMVSVAKCESRFRQFNDDGTVLRGSNLYVGIFQIDEKIHADFAQSLGMDIYTVGGNLAYAKRLYQQSGSRPWANCARTAPSYEAGSTLAGNLKMGDRNAAVKTLQQLLNAAGFVISKTGAGAPGAETDYFGTLTRDAVRRFQCARAIVCSGSESTTGYGMVGPKTRAALIGS